LGGALSPMLLGINRLRAGGGDAARFDSWALHMTAP
jgi:hypothetical protein